jgi:hypothetical protein
MTVLLTVGVGAIGAAVTLVLLVARTLAAKEVNGRIERRVRRHVEATIESLPPHLQEEWADEWRGELAAVIAMPLEAVRFARNVRRSAVQLVGEPALVPSRVRDVRLPWHRWVRVPESTVSAWMMWFKELTRWGSGPRWTFLVLEMLALVLSLATSVMLVLGAWNGGSRVPFAGAGIATIVFLILRVFRRSS